MLYDPCANCPRPADHRKLCQGTPPVCGEPLRKGLCSRAAEHWDYVGRKSVNRASYDTHTRLLHNQMLHPSVYKGGAQ